MLSVNHHKYKCHQPHAKGHSIGGSRGRRRGAPTHNGQKCSQFSCSFFLNFWQNRMFAPPPGGVAPTSTGILDSVVNCSRNKWFPDPPIDTSYLLQKLFKINFLTKRGNMKLQRKEL